MKQPFYLTTTLPYVNASPHIGFALEIVQADAVCRYQRLLGKEVIFNTGTDEHGKKIHEKAQEAGIDAYKYTSEYAAKFDALKQALNLSYNKFIRTTNPDHKSAAQEFWKLCFNNGDIYKKNYQTKYCVGCELEKTDSELVDNKCPDHPTREIEFKDEENYFFAFSKYQEKLLKLYEDNPNFVIPANRQKEITNFVKSGLQDFSISRLKTKMPWGVPVPDDNDHVMYVWFDALVNYISTLGWPNNTAEFETYWPGVQVAGKDNLRQQTAMWQAMLMSAGLPNSTQIFIHGFITSEGQKMSKSTGNVVNPYDVVDEYGTDAVRYYLLGALPSYDDGDWSKERFEEFYTAHLANGVGNLTSRILTMVEKYVTKGFSFEELPPELFDTKDFWKTYDELISKYKFEDLISHINKLVTECDTIISKEKPWEKAKNGEDIFSLLYQLAETLRHIGQALLPIIPEAGKKIIRSLKQDNKTLQTEWGIIKKEISIKKGDPLFPRLDKKIK